MDRHALIFSGGATPTPHLVRHLGPLLPAAALTVAVDRGYDVARALDRAADVLIGDLDSISPAGLAHATGTGVRIERHPADKDATDLELGLRWAIEAGATAMTIVSGAGDRLDHLFAEVALLAAAPYAAVRIDAWIDGAHVQVLHGPAAATAVGRPDDIVTLLAVHGPATGIVTEGLAFPLRGETLVPGETRGVSNRIAAPSAAVRLHSGCLLVICPAALATE